MTVTLTKTLTTTPNSATPNSTTGPAPTGAAAGAGVEEVRVPVGPGWQALSDAMADEAPMIADRDDLLVTIAPGAGRGAPACLLPAEAMIEIDAVHLGGLDPETLRPDLAEDRERYGAVWGLFTHECAHGRHSVWDPPAGASPGAVAAAELLEESRIEAAQVAARPQDRHWLRASACALILADTPTRPPTGDPDDPDGRAEVTRAVAARSAALLLARRDGGVLTAAEVGDVEATVTAVLGEDTLAELRTVWRGAPTAPAGDPEKLAEAMVALGHRWCEALGTDPDQTDGLPAPHRAHPGPGAPGPGTPGPGGGASSGADEPDPDPRVRDLVEAVTKAAREVAAHVATEKAPLDPAAERRARAAAERSAVDRTAKQADQVFGGHGSTFTGETMTRGTREPTPAERSAARVVGRSVSTAGVPDKVTTRTGSTVPPGRLRMRGARAADAQRAAGATVTAEPFVRTTRATVPAPPLRVGIACDVSGSMGAFAGPVASAAWILAAATRHSQVPATSATVIFGCEVRAITHPGTCPPRVTDFYAADGTEVPSHAIDALDGALSLARSDGARLLVIVSDGRFGLNGERARAQARVDRLRATGAAVLWLTPDNPLATPLDRVTVHTLTDPTTTARAIAHAATTALRAAAR